MGNARGFDDVVIGRHCAARSTREMHLRRGDVIPLSEMGPSAVAGAPGVPLLACDDMSEPP